MSSKACLPSSCLEVSELLGSVERPARYTGGERHVIHKRGPLRARLALCFADLYEVAESYLGFKILYDIVNAAEGFAAERVYAPAPDLEAKLRASGTPLWSLDERRPLGQFEVIGFTLQYELSYPTMLAMLELGSVPWRAEARAAGDPFVIGGGAGALNPEPIAPFFDAFVLGDGEEAVLEVLRVVADGKGKSRAATLRELGKLPGVYVPANFEVTYRGLAVDAPAPTKIRRRVVDDLDAAPYPTRQIEPNVRPVHDRFAIELQRGCSRGCRFCQAGMTQRPTRQRSAAVVLDIARQAIAESGVDTLGLLSLSAGDYGALEEILAALLAVCEPCRVRLSLPSLRTETLTAEVARACGRSFTLAPEAASERLRRVINKTNTEADLLAAVEAAVRAGAQSLKLYFMIGLPTETDDDVDEIAALARRVRALARRIKRSVQVTVAISTFVPKPHTPFQFEAQLSEKETLQKQRRLRELLRGTAIALRYHDAGQSFVEGVLARGDRRLAPALEEVARRGGRLDAWTEHFEVERWRTAFVRALEEHGLSPEDYLGARQEEEVLPWDHLDAGVQKSFLLRERARARAEEMSEDCALFGGCHACGACGLGDPEIKAVPVIAIARPREAWAKLPETLPEAPTASCERRARVRCRYEKMGAAVHLSQLETTDKILRGIRHARLPVLFSQGYTPRPRVSFSPACPTGIESEAEYFEALCYEDLPAENWRTRLNDYLPEGLRVLEAATLSDLAPPLGAVIEAMRYRVACAVPDADLRALVEGFLAKTEHKLEVMRKGVPRLIDARATVRHLEVCEAGLELTLALGREASPKLAEVLPVIFGETIAYRARKIAAVFAATTASR